MKLLRIGVIQFAETTCFASALKVRFGDITVESTPVTFNKKRDSRLLIVASIDLSETVTFDRDGYVIVPEKPRIACEGGIENLANLLALTARTGRRIASAVPYIAFSEVSDDELARLQSSRGFRFQPRTQCSASCPTDVINGALVSSLADRLGGVALLGEAVSAGHPVGKYRELLRFFENAFARPLSSIDKKLAQLLRETDLGYTREEVAAWFALRDGSIHGDLKSAERLVMEPDVRPYLPRMEQAAYEVLFNKASWHDPSSGRRNVFRHEVATTDRDARDLRITRGRPASLDWQVSDPFGTFALDLNAVLNPVPTHWWWKSSDVDEQSNPPLQPTGSAGG